MATATQDTATSRKPDLSVRFSGITFKNPVIAAAGTFGYGIEFEDIVTLEKLGGFVTKGLSREPMVGNPPPRLFETAAGMLNSIGLQNIGARAFIDEKLPRLAQKKSVIVIANVFGYTREDYVETIRILNEAEGIAAYELNVSCPNTHEGGMVFGTDRTLLEELVASCKSAASRPLIVKLSPNVTSIAAMAKSAENAGADAVSLVNTFVGMAIDAKTRKPRISNITAGLSGPAFFGSRSQLVRLARCLPGPTASTTPIFASRCARHVPWSARAMSGMTMPPAVCSRGGSMRTMMPSRMGRTVTAWPAR